jgi:uncharacterized membrane protein YdjX (TVP38/TMEM64 family)
LSEKPTQTAALRGVFFPGMSTYRTGKQTTDIPILVRGFAKASVTKEVLERPVFLIQNTKLLHTKLLHIKLLLWAALVLGFMVLFAVFPGLNDPTQWTAWIRPESLRFWLLWIGLQATFAVFMVPTLPLVIAAALALPDHKALVLGMSLCGVLLSALAIHRNAHGLNLDRLWRSHPRLHQGADVIRQRGAVGLMFWCAAPFLPSDFGCYIAASSGMPRHKYLLAVLCGEAMLCAAIIYGAVGVLV